MAGVRNRWRVHAAVLACAGLMVAGPHVVVARPALPMDPADEQVASQWANPRVRPGVKGVDMSLDRLLVAGVDVTALPAGGVADATFTLANDSASPLEDVVVSWRRADAVGSVAEARVALAADDEQYRTVGQSVPFASAVQARSSVTGSVVLDSAALDMRVPGTYPVLLSVESQGRVVDSERMLLRVVDPAADAGTASAGTVGAGAAATPGGDGGDDTSVEEPAAVSGVPASLVWPVTATTHIVAGATGQAPDRAPLILADEELAQQMAPGGRLDMLIDTYRQATADPQVAMASCLALDPAVIDTASRMANGYTVSATRPSPVATKLRLRDSWGSASHEHPGQPGSGSRTAADWLAKVRTVAQGGCTVALPWANADINGLVRTGSPWLVREALAEGSATLERVLGATPVQNAVLPGSGFVTPDTAGALRLVGDADIAAAWEASQPAAPADPGSARPALDAQDTPELVTADPHTPGDATVLVADNTVWAAPHTPHSAALAPGVNGALFDGSLAAMLAELGPHPETVPYSNPESRYDYRRDSEAARRIDAAAAMNLATRADAQGPMIVVPPRNLATPQDMAVVLSTFRQLLEQQAATPLPFGEAIAAPAGGDQLRPLAAPAPDAYGSPFVDPGSVSDTEILRGAQQASYIDDLARLMVNDPQIALTRYRFVEPLLRDIVTAFSLNGRLSASTHMQAVSRADNILNGNRDMLTLLRTSVSLLPPGNVFTRTSQASPLPMVARNGLPLPVIARLEYATTAGEIVPPAQQLIPAKGSVTIMLDATLPDTDDRTDIRLWLATPSGAAISAPIDIGVQTRAGLFAKGAAAAAVVLVLLIGLIGRFIVRRRAAGRQAKQSDTARQGGAPRTPQQPTQATEAPQAGQPQQPRQYRIPRRTTRRQPGDQQK